MKKFFPFFLSLLVFLFSRSVWAGSIQVSSGAFPAGGDIPSQFTCDGENISPALRWSGAPKKTASIALTMQDPDAPAGTWVHWVLFNLPPTIDNLPQDMPPLQRLANGEAHGKNDFGNLGYGGPCPPKGPAHRYFFKIYALDIELQLPKGLPAGQAGAAKQEFLEALKGHILAEGELMGRYARK